MNRLDRPGLKLLIPRNEIRDRVAALGRRITGDFAGRPLVVLGVLNGAFAFLADLGRELDLDCRIDFVALASYGAGTSPRSAVRARLDAEVDVAGRDVLVVEDVVDTGGTLRFLRDRLAARGARSVWFCVLLDKRDAPGDVDVDYVGFRVASRFVVGYGLDLDGRYRCLPDLYTLEGNG